MDEWALSAKLANNLSSYIIKLVCWKYTNKLYYHMIGRHISQFIDVTVKTINHEHIKKTLCQPQVWFGPLIKQEPQKKYFSLKKCPIHVNTMFPFKESLSFFYKMLAQMGAPFIYYDLI